MNYQCFFSKRFLTKPFLTMMAAAAIIALAPLSRADANGFLQTNRFRWFGCGENDGSTSGEPLGSRVLPGRPVLDFG